MMVFTTQLGAALPMWQRLNSVSMTIPSGCAVATFGLSAALFLATSLQSLELHSSQHLDEEVADSTDAPQRWSSDHISNMSQLCALAFQAICASEGMLLVLPELQRLQGVRINAASIAQNKWVPAELCSHEVTASVAFAKEPIAALLNVAHMACEFTDHMLNANSSHSWPSSMQEQCKLGARLAKQHLTSTGSPCTLVQGLRISVAPKLLSLGLRQTASVPPSAWSHRTQLTALQLHDCSFAEPAHIAAMLRTLQQLQVLQMVRVKQKRATAATHASRQALLKIVLPQLQYVDFTASPDVAASPLAVFDLLSQCPRLEEVVLDDVRTDAKFAGAPLEDALHNVTAADCAFTGGSTTELVPGRSALRHFSARNTPGAVSVLARLVKQHAAVPPQLEYLNFANCYALPAGVLQALVKQTRLRSIILQGCIRSIAPPQVWYLDIGSVLHLVPSWCQAPSLCSPFTQSSAVFIMTCDGSFDWRHK